MSPRGPNTPGIDDDVPDQIRECLERYSHRQKFQVAVDIVNVQSLGISLAESATDLGDSYNYFNDVEGDAAFYYFPNPEVDGGVMMYAQGTGWYCIDDPEYMDELKEWFTEEFDEYKDAPYTFSLFGGT